MVDEILKLRKSDFVRLEWLELGMVKFRNTKKMPRLRPKECYFVGQVLKLFADDFLFKVIYSSNNLSESTVVIKKSKILADLKMLKKDKKRKLIETDVIKQDGEEQFYVLNLRKIKKSDVILYEL